MNGKRLLLEVSQAAVVIIVSSLFVFYRNLFLFFAQDDFYLLARSKVYSLQEFFGLFLPQVETVWYRPLSQYIFFFFAQTLFGLKPFFFHLILFITHWLNSLILWLLLRKLFDSFLLRLVGLIFFVVHPVHFLSLSWAAAYGFMLGPSFFLLSILFYLSFLKNKSIKHYLASLCAFLLALLSIEVNIILLPVVIGLDFVHLGRKSFFKKTSERFLPFFFITLIILWLRFIAFPTQIGGAYQLSSAELPQTARFYSLRLFGVAEHAGATSGLIKRVHLLAVLVSTAFTFALPFLFAGKKIVSAKNFQIGLVIFSLSLLPFIFLPFHRSAHYLSFALVGMSVVVVTCLERISWVLTRPKRKGYLLIVSGFLLFSAFSANFIEWRTHWIIKRAQLARELINQNVLEVPVGTEEYFALGANYAKKVFSAQ